MLLVWRPELVGDVELRQLKQPWTFGALRSFAANDPGMTLLLDWFFPPICGEEMSIYVKWFTRIGRFFAFGFFVIWRSICKGVVLYGALLHRPISKFNAFLGTIFLMGR